MKKSEENILNPSKIQRALAFLVAFAVSLHIPVAMLLKGSNKKSEKALPTSNESIIAITSDDSMSLETSINSETQTPQIEEESRKSCPFLTNYESGKEYSFSIDGQVYTELTCRGTIPDPGMPNLLDNKKTEFPGYEATKTVYTFSSSTGKAYVQIRELKNSANITCVYSVDTYLYAIPLSDITLSSSEAIMYLSSDMLLIFKETIVTDAGKEAGFSNATEACVTVETDLGSAPFYGYSCTVTEAGPTKECSERSDPTMSLLPLLK